MATLRRKTLSFRRKRQYDLEATKEAIVKKFPSMSYSKIMSPAAQAALAVDAEDITDNRETVIETVVPVTSDAPSTDTDAENESNKNEDENSIARFLKGKLTSLSQRVKSSTNYRKTRLINSPGTPNVLGRRRSIRLQKKTPLKSVCNTENVNSSVKLKRYRNQSQERRNVLSPGQFNRKMEAVTKGIKSLSKLSDGLTTKIQRQSSRILKEVATTARETRSTPMRRQFSYRNAVTSGSNENLL